MAVTGEEAKAVRQLLPQQLQERGSRLWEAHGRTSTISKLHKVIPLHYWRQKTGYILIPPGIRFARNLDGIIEGGIKMNKAKSRHESTMQLQKLHICTQG